MPRFSCLIVSYQCGEYLQACLRTLFNQLAGSSFEVIVVDNASTDCGVTKARALNLPVQWICLSENVGFGKANNLAASHASGDYLVLLNPDTELRQDSITQLLDYLDNHTDIGLIGGHHEDGAGGWQCSFGLTPRLRYELEYAINPTGFWARLPKVTPESPVEVDWVCGSFMVLRRIVSHSIGLFDERFFLNDEDIELCDRVRAANLRIVYHPARGLVHFGGVSKSLCPTSSKEYSRSRRLYYRIKHGRLTEGIYLIALALRSLRDTLARHKAYWRSYVMANLRP